ncbi:MAG TPA: hypothetical protein VJ723_13025 [Candidatus Angelobacter sp.]|nr:hypothetical protein [Candidatus Angelobacter sp.]
MPKTYEYHEGKKAQDNFESGMKALFQVPKEAVERPKKAKKKREKPIKRGPSRDAGGDT